MTRVGTHRVDGAGEAGPARAHGVEIRAGGFKPRMVGLIGRKAGGGFRPSPISRASTTRRDEVPERSAGRSTSAAGRRRSRSRRLLLGPPEPAERLAGLSLGDATSSSRPTALTPSRPRPRPARARTSPELSGHTRGTVRRRR